jgi:hypothetical protein
MENVLSGSTENTDEKRNNFVGPFDVAKENALRFIFGMQTLSTFRTISERVQFLEAMMELPLVKSGTTGDAKIVAKQYAKEMEELDTAIIIFCSLPEAPEA